MTYTSHLHHIPGTPKEEPVFLPFNCGGLGVCESCTFEVRWFADRDKHRARLFPSESVSLDSQILRKISDKLRSKNPKPRLSMLIEDYKLSRTIHALADAIDGVANDS